MSGAGIKILVVDDDDAARYVKRRVLQTAGYVLSETALGRAAIERVATDPPDLILLDVKLPDISGIEVCRQIKAAAPSILILQTSAAFTSARDRTAALDGGADSYLIEPIEPDELVAAVKTLLRLRQAEQELRRANGTLEARVAERTCELAEANRRLEAEGEQRRKAEEALWHAQKLEAVGQLTGGLAHDFNNLLTVIVGNLEMLEENMLGQLTLTPERSLRLVKAAEKAAERGAQLTQQLLAFARRGVLRYETVDLNAVFSSLDDFLRRALGETIALEFSYAPDLWLSQIDVAQFESAMLNLVVNARDAMPAGGTLRIATSNATIDAAGSGDDVPAKPGEYVRVRITDTGTGMEPGIASRAFEPFFTTKEVGKGSGLGLSQVYGFVQQSGGHVAIESALGVGTTVILYMPRSETPLTVRDDRSEGPASVSTAHETVLIVEDNPEVLVVASSMIHDLGYKVLVASDGVEALALIRTDAPIDLLFSDVVMPRGINGFELAARARSIRSGLKILLTSGYPARDRVAIESANLPVVLKPYRRDELARKIRRVLASPA